jgi:hypothetical protein
MTGQHTLLNEQILSLEEKANNVILRNYQPMECQPSSVDKCHRMTIPVQGTTSTYKFSVNHSRNVIKPNKNHKIMAVGNRRARGCAMR